MQHPVDSASGRPSPEGSFPWFPQDLPKCITTVTSSNHRVPKFESLQAGRGLAAIMVVLYHTEGIISLSKYWHGATRYFHFGAAGVGFFFVLSGIVILHAHYDDLGEPRKLIQYCWKRLRRIYPIYWVVLLAILPMYFVFPSLGSGFERAPSVIAESLLLIPIVRVETIIPVAWTLFHEVMFYLAFSLLIWRRTAGIAIMAIWMLASIWSVFFPPANEVLASYISPLHLLFGLGMMIAVVVRRSAVSGLPFVLIGTCGFITFCYIDDMHRSIMPSLALALGLCAGIAATGFMLFEKERTLRIPSFLIFLGEASYSIYLIHYTTLSISAKVVHRLWLLHPVPIWIPGALLFVIAVASGIALHIFVETPLLGRIPRAIASLRPFRFG
jgi:exopolysaccharide production protein ExoZ